MITDNNFYIEKEKEQRWTKQKIRKTYSVEKLHYPTPKANALMADLIPRVILKKFPDPMVDALLLFAEGDAIRKFVDLCGPTRAIDYVQYEFRKTIRGRFGLPPSQSFVTEMENRRCTFDFNVVHKSSSEEELKEEENIYF